MFKNWKTSGAGILGLLTTIFNCIATKNVTPTDIGIVVSSIGLILAKDSNVTGGTVQQ